MTVKLSFEHSYETMVKLSFGDHAVLVIPIQRTIWKIAPTKLNNDTSKPIPIYGGEWRSLNRLVTSFPV